jgi:hypothetical protein
MAQQLIWGARLGLPILVESAGTSVAPSLVLVLTIVGVTTGISHWNGSRAQAGENERLVDGFYLVQRSGSSATAVSFTGLDANGNVLTP